MKLECRVLSPGSMHFPRCFKAAAYVACPEESQ